MCFAEDLEMSKTLSVLQEVLIIREKGGQTHTYETIWYNRGKAGCDQPVLGEDQTSHQKSCLNQGMKYNQEPGK